MFDVQAHGVRCECDWCHGLRCKALLAPGPHGRREGVCSDCGEPAGRPFRPSYYPLCKTCPFKRYAVLDFGLSGIVAVLVPTLRSVLEDLALLSRSECVVCGLADVACIRTDADAGESYPGLCLSCAAWRTLDGIIS